MLDLRGFMNNWPYNDNIFVLRVMMMQKNMFIKKYFTYAVDQENDVSSLVEELF